MRAMRRFAVFVVLCLTPFGPALSQSIPVNPMFGTRLMQAQPNCFFGRAPSIFQRATSSQELVAFDANDQCLINSGGSLIYYNFGGMARLTFSGISSGLISFLKSDGLLPANVATVQFTGYTQVWNSTAHSLHVKFSIVFPFGSQPIDATYYSQ